MFPPSVTEPRAGRARLMLLGDVAASTDKIDTVDFSTTAEASTRIVLAGAAAIRTKDDKALIPRHVVSAVIAAVQGWESYWVLNGRLRYCEAQGAWRGAASGAAITPRLLSPDWKALAEVGLIDDGLSRSHHVEFSLTRLGESFIPVIARHQLGAHAT